MSEVFDVYGRYYDLLYRDKDYAAEADYVASILERIAPGAKQVLELGCGTGAHAEHLARRGLSVHGVDLSVSMLGAAQARKSAAPADVAARMSFSRGDVRQVRLDNHYDAVISLFHVFSYQTTNEDLSAAFATAAAHLSSGGFFVFDFWHGPAVLAQGPDVRVKRIEDEAIKVTRIAEPVVHPNENVVDVNYEVLIEDKGTGAVQRVREKHRMRYLFMPEVKGLLATQGLELSACYEWMTFDEPGSEAWNACAVARLASWYAA